EGEQAYSIRQTSDKGFIACGYAISDNGDVSGNHGNADYWIVKLDSNGNLKWQKCFGGSDDDIARSVQQTTDGGFIVAGYSKSADGDVSGNHGMYDYWIVRLDSLGNLLWQKSFGGSLDEQAFSIEQIAQGGFIIAGWSESNDGDV